MPLSNDTQPTSHLTDNQQCIVKKLIVFEKWSCLALNFILCKNYVKINSLIKISIFDYLIGIISLLKKIIQ